MSCMSLCISYSSSFQHQLSTATIFFGFQMRRRYSGLYEKYHPRSSEHKVHPESLWILPLSKVLLSHSVLTAAGFCSYPNTIHDTLPIQNRRQRAHSGSSVLSWLQIRLCVITLFSYGKHMTMNCSTIGLCAYLSMCVCDYGYSCMCVHSDSVTGCKQNSWIGKKGHSYNENYF